MRGTSKYKKVDDFYLIKSELKHTDLDLKVLKELQKDKNQSISDLSVKLNIDENLIKELVNELALSMADYSMRAGVRYFMPCLGQHADKDVELFYIKHDFSVSDELSENEMSDIRTDVLAAMLH